MKTRRSVLLLLVIEIICMLSYFLHGTSETSELENRTLMTFDMVLNNPPAEDSIVYKATASERFEDALKDQFFGRDWISLHYANYTAFLENTVSNCRRSFRTLWGLVSGSASKQAEQGNSEPEVDYDRWPGYGLPRLERIPSRDYTLTKMGSLFRFNNTDYIFEGPKVSSPDPEQLKAHAEQIAHIHALYPQIRLYSYFVSSLSSSKWFDGELGYDTPDYFEGIAQAMPEYMRVKRLTYQDEKEYEDLFYKSDHHWSHGGVMQGYSDIYQMIAEDYREMSPCKTPEKLWNFSELYGVEFRGTRAAKLQGFYDGYDEFIVPEYDLGDRDCYSIDPETGEETPVTLGLWETYKAGEMSKERYYDHYVRFYYSAFDADGNERSNEFYLIRNPEMHTGHNLLLVTDSMGRAVRDVLGSHFDSEVYLDYRILKQVKVDEIIEKYHIDTIVMNGIGDVWTGEEYSFHFTDGFGEVE